MTDKSSNAGKAFFTRIAGALAEVDDRYDVVVLDCPPQLGYLTITALTAATAVLITIHPQMLDVMSMGQFLLMLGASWNRSGAAGAAVNLQWYRYVVTRYEPTDQPQAQMVAFLHTLFGEFVLKASDAEVYCDFRRGDNQANALRSREKRDDPLDVRASNDALDSVNGEIVSLVHEAWGR